METNVDELFTAAIEKMIEEHGDKIQGVMLIDNPGPCLPVTLGRGPIVPMNALIKIEELQNEGQDGGEADRTTHG